MLPLRSPDISDSGPRFSKMHFKLELEFTCFNRSTKYTSGTGRERACGPGTPSLKLITPPPGGDSDCKLYLLTPVTCVEDHQVPESYTHKSAPKRSIRKNIRKILDSFRHRRPKNTTAQMDTTPDIDSFIAGNEVKHRRVSELEATRGEMYSNNSGRPIPIPELPAWTRGELEGSSYHDQSSVSQTLDYESSCYQQTSLHFSNDDSSPNDHSVYPSNDPDFQFAVHRPINARPKSDGCSKFPYHGTPHKLDTNTSTWDKHSMATTSSISTQTPSTISPYSTNTSVSQKTGHSYYSSPSSISAFSPQYGYSPTHQDTNYFNPSPPHVYCPHKYQVSQADFNTSTLTSGHQDPTYCAPGPSKPSYSTSSYLGSPLNGAMAFQSGDPTDREYDVINTSKYCSPSSSSAESTPTAPQEAMQNSFDGTHSSHRREVPANSRWYRRSRIHRMYDMSTSELLLEEEPHNGTLPMYSPDDQSPNYNPASPTTFPQPQAKKTRLKPSRSNADAPSEPVGCPQCDKKFTGRFQEGNRKRHMKWIHAVTLTYCRRCSNSYRRSDACRKHEWKKHRLEDTRPNKRS